MFVFIRWVWDGMGEDGVVVGEEYGTELVLSLASLEIVLQAEDMLSTSR